MMMFRFGLFFVKPDQLFLVDLSELILFYMIDESDHRRNAILR